MTLNTARIEGIASSLEAIAHQEDPINTILEEWQRPNGITFKKVRVPIGVIGIIFESRPNVTADAGALCIKSGNAAFLRGGSESMYSSKALLECLHKGLKSAGLPEDAVQLVETTDRAAVGKMLQLNQYIDVIIPRGGKSLIKRVAAESTIPVIKHLDGICHIYIDKAADIEKAVKITQNAKMRRTGVCGAVETLLVHQDIAQQVLPSLQTALQNCELRGDEKVQAIINVNPASDEDWATEYLDSVLSIKVVDDLTAAIDHIQHYSSDHTDSIITEDQQAADLFQQQVNSAIVLHNASTQFADGGEFGFGAEIGISTDKLHARGPVGAMHLTTYKYLGTANCAIRT